MEKRSDTESSEEILGDWDLTPPVDPEERVVMVSVPPESDYARPNQPKEIETRVSDKERNVAGESSARRVLPPWMDPSYEWGGGKWKEDGRKKKKKDKEKEKEKKKEEIIPFKEIIEALLRNSGDKVQEDKVKQSQSSVEMLKSLGFKFP
ncbi:unnamed protein product [Arabidopsis lyrata]|uniref:uncharacterized protein LOC9328149 n=1 Tax=Arabidopsis lyrata subsp. lyrata TaxID=81972 RepID=UPI000A29ABBD|nr:uncharacterized protein LOC9328149 [Arabidopsis lyrata subsp. lyrata]CAH8250877.1 unnamed protein product [Arabidopsis lyrata]|eukprot:XP_020866517.1 uncharacterized protein LOC9328149 [Arabidopsis lyrata subsp. lyrata]